ncbi:MAG: glycosyltransferase, partial [Patescibacteria group bacterium]|nr:glycosyltransferase [Patescibacteria group bacterium]
MKIVVLSFTSEKIDRGVETVVRELVKRWQKKYEVKMFSAVGLGMKVNWKKISKGNIWRALMFDYYHFKIFMFTIKALWKVGKPKVIIAVNGGWQALVCRLYCWLRGVKLVIPGLAGLGWCDRWNLLMQPNVFVASTKRNADWARKYNKRVKIEIIPHGVDLKRFKPEGKKIKLNLNKPVILCVAGSNKYKRVEATIKAVSKLEKASLLLVGGSEELEELGKKLLGERFLR